MNENKTIERGNFLGSIWGNLDSIRSQIINLYKDSIEVNELIGGDLEVIDLALSAVQNRLEIRSRVLHNYNLGGKNNENI